MTGKEILAEAKEKMAKSGDALKRTLADIRAGQREPLKHGNG